MASDPTWMHVVALALRDAQGRLLLQERPVGKHHGGLWEFPGGKVEARENPRAALCREIAEELSIAIDPASLRPALLADQAGDAPIVLFLYSCTSWTGEIVALEGQRWGWYRREEAANLPMPPMDADLLDRLPL